MASMNFPPTPTVGDEYVWEDFVYEWDGEKWTTQVTVVADNHVLKTGDTMTGKLTLPNLQTDAFLAFQEVNQLGTVLSSNSAGYTEIVRRTDAGPEWSTGLRAYGGADWRIGAEPIITAAGGTLTGPLKLSSTGTDEERIVGLTDGNPSWFVGKEAGDADVVLYSYDHGNYLTIKADSIQFAKDPVSNAAQGTGGASLTRKDYVDNTFVKKSGDTMTGVLTVKNPEDVRRTDIHVDGMSFLTDNIRNWHTFHELSDNSWRVAYYDATGVYAGTSIIVQSEGATILLNPASMTGQGQLPESLTRKDYVDASLLVKADVDRVNTLEATITALLARIEALEAQVNPAP